MPAFWICKEEKVAMPAEAAVVAPVMIVPGPLRTLSVTPIADETVLPLASTTRTVKLGADVPAVAVDGCVPNTSRMAPVAATMLNALLFARANPVEVACSVQPLACVAPVVTALNVATPLTVLTLVVPEIVPPVHVCAVTATAVGA